MPSGVDVLGTLSEKLKQLTNEAKDHRTSFTDLTKLYKEDKINEKDFFSKVLNYVVTSSALTFLMARVVLELKSALEKGTTIKDVTGGATSTSSAPQMGGFGIGRNIQSPIIKNGCPHQSTIMSFLFNLIHTRVNEFLSLWVSYHILKGF